MPMYCAPLQLTTTGRLNDDCDKKENGSRSEPETTDNSDDDSDSLELLVEKIDELRSTIKSKQDEWTDKQYYEYQEILGEKIQKREIILEKQRVAEAMREFNKQYPEATKCCPICSDPIDMNPIDGGAPLLCCGQFTCYECHEAAIAVAKIRNCPLCAGKIPLELDDKIRRIQNLADSGNSWAQYEMGRRLENGDGMKKNVQHAMYWYKLGASQGERCAQYNLGLLHYENDEEKARHWFKAAAIQGLAAAQHILGIMSFYGEGGNVDMGAAICWLTLTTAQKHRPELQDTMMDTYYHLGECCRRVGTLEFYCRAKYWLMKAIKQGESLSYLAFAQTLLGLSKSLYGDDNIVGHSAIPEAMYWLRKATANNIDGAINCQKAIENRISPLCSCCKVFYSSRKLKACTRCKAAFFCSKACAKKHWRNGHRIDCRDAYDE